MACFETDSLHVPSLLHLHDTEPLRLRSIFDTLAFRHSLWNRRYVADLGRWSRNDLLPHHHLTSSNWSLRDWDENDEIHLCFEPR